MKKILLLSTIFSLVLFTACVEEEDISHVLPEPGDTELLEVAPTSKGIMPTSVSVLADFDIELVNGTVNELVKLNLTNKSVNAVSYEWDFGNDFTSSAEVPDYKYKNHGYYDITLKATGADGTVSEVTKEVLVLCIYGGGEHDF